MTENQWLPSDLLLWGVDPLSYPIRLFHLAIRIVVHVCKLVSSVQQIQSRTLKLNFAGRKNNESIRGVRKSGDQ